MKITFVKLEAKIKANQFLFSVSLEIKQLLFKVEAKFLCAVFSFK